MVVSILRSRYHFLFVACFLLVSGCDPLRDTDYIRDRATLLSLKREEMLAEAHLRGLLSICVMPVRGQTTLHGSWSSPEAQLATDNRERASLRVQYEELFRKLNFVVIDRSESELMQLQSEALRRNSHDFGAEAIIGRSVGAEIVACMDLDIIREAYFVPYSGWHTRGWTIFTERFINARDNTLLYSYSCDDRTSKKYISQIKDTPIFRGTRILIANPNRTPEVYTSANQEFALVDAESASWQVNYILGGWFFDKQHGGLHPDARRIAQKHFQAFLRKQPGDGFLNAVARSCIDELEDSKEKAGEERVVAASKLPRGSLFLNGQLERASALLGISKQRVLDRLKQTPSSSAATVEGAFSITSVEPAVVWIISERRDGVVGSGSGFVVADGFVITNAHVVAESARVTVRYWDSVTTDGEIVALDESADLALVRVTRKDLKSLKLLEGERLPKGTTVFAVGNPSGLERTITRGIISGYREGESVMYVQTDAAINPGNSGGPLVDENGQVVGVATMKTKDAEGLGFCISAESVNSFVRNHLP